MVGLAVVGQTAVVVFKVGVAYVRAAKGTVNALFAVVIVVVPFVVRGVVYRLVRFCLAELKPADAGKKAVRYPLFVVSVVLAVEVGRVSDGL